MSTEVTPTSTSSHEDPGGAGWEDPSLGSYRELLPEGATRSFFWIAGKVLRVSRNHLLAYIHDPVSDQRRAWMRRLSDAASAPMINSSSAQTSGASRSFSSAILEKETIRSTRWSRPC